MVPKILLWIVILVCVNQGSCNNLTTKEEEEILNWIPPEDSKAKYPYYLSGYDREGSPVYIVEIGKWDTRSAVEAGPEATAVVDKIVAQLLLRGRTPGIEAPESPGTLVIIDGEGFNARQASHLPTISFWMKQSSKVESFLRTPGLKKAYGINFSFLMQRLFEIATPLLGATAQFFEVYGTNPDKWKPLLLKQIDPGQLPPRYGGSKDHKPLKIFP